MKKINWLLIPLLILSSCKKDSSVADASKEDSASFLGDPIIAEVDSAVYRDSIVNNAAMTKKVLKDGIMRVDEGNKIVREVDASAIPFNLGEAFSEGHDQLVLKITNFKGNEISAIVAPENKDMNIRINTIELSNGTKDGPFGHELKNYKVEKSDEVILSIGKNNMASGELKGNFNIRIE